MLKNEQEKAEAENFSVAVPLSTDTGKDFVPETPSCCGTNITTSGIRLVPTHCST